MSVGTDSGATLPQLALPLHSRRFLVARRLHLWFFHRERCYILRASLPALLGSPRPASAVLCHLSWRDWNRLRSACSENHSCVRSIWRVARQEEAALAKYGESRVLVQRLRALRTSFCSFCLLSLLSYVCAALAVQDTARTQWTASARGRQVFISFSRPHACHAAGSSVSSARCWLDDALPSFFQSPAHLAGRSRKPSTPAGRAERTACALFWRPWPQVLGARCTGAAFVMQAAVSLVCPPGMT